MKLTKPAWMDKLLFANYIINHQIKESEYMTYKVETLPCRNPYNN